MTTKQDYLNDEKERNSKWILFKNFLHHELGITKEDIRAWVKEAVKDEAVRLVNNTYDNFSPERVVKSVLYQHDLFQGDTLKKDIVKEAAKLLVEKIKLVPVEESTEKVTSAKPVVLDIEPAACGCVRIIQSETDKTLFICSCGETRRRLIK